MQAELWDELVAQVEVHGASRVEATLTTDSGEGTIDLIDVKFEDDRIKLVFA